jgi:hypothetical protein
MKTYTVTIEGVKGLFKRRIEADGYRGPGNKLTASMGNYEFYVHNTTAGGQLEAVIVAAYNPEFVVSVELQYA